MDSTDKISNDTDKSASTATSAASTSKVSESIYDEVPGATGPMHDPGYGPVPTAAPEPEHEHVKPATSTASTASTSTASASSAPKEAAKPTPPPPPAAGPTPPPAGGPVNNPGGYPPPPGPAPYGAGGYQPGYGPVPSQNNGFPPGYNPNQPGYQPGHGYTQGYQPGYGPVPPQNNGFPPGYNPNTQNQHQGQQASTAQPGGPINLNKDASSSSQGTSQSGANPYDNSTQTPYGAPSGGAGFGFKNFGAGGTINYSIVSAIVGGLSFICCCCCGCFSIPVSIIGVILGIMGYRNEPDGKVLSIIGIALSATSLAIAIVYSFVVGVSGLAGMLSDY